MLAGQSAANITSKVILVCNYYIIITKCTEATRSTVPG